MDDSAIDRAIDETARAMTAGEPGGAFRAHVMERLDERPALRRPVWILWPTVAAAAIALAVLIGRSTPPTPAATPQTARVDLRARVLPLVASMPGRVPAPRNTDQVQQAIHPTGESDLAALAPPRLEVPSLALTAMPPGESIQIQELETITPITIAPIGEPQGERP